MNNLRCTAFIFARGGSKGLPGKNIRPLGGVPLIGHSIRTARALESVDRVVVSTDDEAIAAVAREYGADVIKRPDELAQDDTPEWLAWRHAVRTIEEQNARPIETFLSLPCTAPLRAVADVHACLDLFHEGDSDIVVTVRDAERNPYFNMVVMDERGHAHLAVKPTKLISRRQDAPVVYDMTTVAYVTSPAFIMRASNQFEGRVKAVKIPWERAVDIDTALDFSIAEFLYSKAMEKTKVIAQVPDAVGVRM